MFIAGTKWNMNWLNLVLLEWMNEYLIKQHYIQIDRYWPRNVLLDTITEVQEKLTIEVMLLRVSVTLSKLVGNL